MALLTALTLCKVQSLRPEKLSGTYATKLNMQVSVSAVLTQREDICECSSSMVVEDINTPDKNHLYRACITCQWLRPLSSIPDTSNEQQ
jgi:hypothetical protein